MGSNGDLMGSYGDLTMETNITMENHHFSMGKSLCMAIFNVSLPEGNQVIFDGDKIDG